jgi:hypothetical protein
MYKLFLFSQLFSQLISFGLLPKPKDPTDKFKRALKFQKEITDTLEKIAEVSPKAARQFAQTMLDGMDNGVLKDTTFKDVSVYLTPIDTEPEIVELLKERNCLVNLING